MGSRTSAGARPLPARETGARRAAPGAPQPRARAEPGGAPQSEERLRIATRTHGPPAPAASGAPPPPPGGGGISSGRVLRRRCASCGALLDEERAPTGAPVLRRCAACERALSEAKPAPGGCSCDTGRAADLVAGTLRGGGRPLDPATRAFFEARFGQDLGGVRVHDGASADRSARAVGALAYTVGQDIAFRAGYFAPGTGEGRRLLAHEVAHVVQQGRGGGARLAAAPDAPLAVGRADDPLEREADAAAARALLPGPASPPAVSPDTGRTLRRQAGAAAPTREAGAGDRQPTPGAPVASGEGTYAQLFLDHPEVARPVEVLSARYRTLIRNLDPVLEGAGVYARGTFEVYVQRQSRRAVFELENQIATEDLYEPGALSLWVEKVQQALRHLQPLLAMLRGTGDTSADFWDDERRRLAEDAERLAQTPYMQRGVRQREEEERVQRQVARIEAAVEFLREHTRRHWRRDNADIVMGMFGTDAAATLVHEHHLTGDEIRTVFARLEEIDPRLLEAAQYRGRTIQALLEMGIGGFQAYYSQGEGFLAGFIRAAGESELAQPPGSRQFNVVERLEATGGFVAGLFQGVGDSIIDNIRAVVELFTPQFWRDLWQMLTDFLPRFATSDQFRFSIGQMMGISAVGEERRLATAEPFEYGRTIGHIFGYALTETVLSFIGLGWILRGIRGVARLTRIYEPLAALARRIGRSAIAARGLQVARAVGESIQAISERIRRLRARLPALTPDARLRQTLWEMEALDRRAAELSRRASEVEEQARRALALGDYEGAQRHIDELSRLADELERGAPEAAAATRRAETVSVGHGVEPREMELLDRTRTREGAALTPDELRAELEIVRRRFAQAPDAGEVRLPNDHSWERRREGLFCRHSDGEYCVLPGLSQAQNARLQEIVTELEQIGVRFHAEGSLGDFFSRYPNPDDALAELARLAEGERIRRGATAAVAAPGEAATAERAAQAVDQPGPTVQPTAPRPTPTTPGWRRARELGWPDPEPGYYWYWREGQDVPSYRRSPGARDAQGEPLPERYYDPDTSQFRNTRDRPAAGGTGGAPLARGPADNPHPGWENGRIPCFPAGTLVWLEEGSVPIERVRAGDRVQAYDFRTGEVVLREVDGVIHGRTQVWVDVEVAGSTLRATRRHPFWVESGQEWRPAAELAEGATLRLRDGRLAAVTAVALRPQPDWQPTYNLSIAGAKNYFVGEPGVLVHNVDIPHDTPGYYVYVLRGPDPLTGEIRIYYVGRFGGNETVNTVRYRHGRNHDRFDPRRRPNPDRLEVVGGPIQYGDARRMEHELSVRHRTYIGEHPTSYRGNRDWPMDADRFREYYAPDAC